MLTQIENRNFAAAESGEQPDGETVQGITESVIVEAAGRKPPGDAVEDADFAVHRTRAGATDRPPAALSVEGGDELSVVPNHPGSGDDPTDWPNSDQHHERDIASDTMNIDGLFGGFGAQSAGSMAPDGGVSWAEVLAGTDDFIRFADALRLINDIGRCVSLPVWRRRVAALQVVGFVYARRRRWRITAS